MKVCLYVLITIRPRLNLSAGWQESIQIITTGIKQPEQLTIHLKDPILIGAIEILFHRSIKMLTKIISMIKIGLLKNNGSKHLINYPIQKSKIRFFI